MVVSRKVRMRNRLRKDAYGICSKISNTSCPCSDPEGGQVVRIHPPPPPHPPEKSQNIGFLSNTGPDPLKNHKATKPAFNVGPSSARQPNTI